MKTLTLEDYQKAGEEFWPKYWYVAKELGEDAKPEQVLKVMEAIGGVALKLALTDKLPPFGFNKKKDDCQIYSIHQGLMWSLWSGKALLQRYERRTHTSHSRSTS